MSVWVGGFRYNMDRKVLTEEDADNFLKYILIYWSVKGLSKLVYNWNIAATKAY